MSSSQKVKFLQQMLSNSVYKVNPYLVGACIAARPLARQHQRVRVAYYCSIHTQARAVKRWHAKKSWSAHSSLCNDVTTLAEALSWKSGRGKSNMSGKPSSRTVVNRAPSSEPTLLAHSCGDGVDAGVFASRAEAVMVTERCRLSCNGNTVHIIKPKKQTYILVWCASVVTTYVIRAPIVRAGTKRKVAQIPVGDLRRLGSTSIRMCLEKCKKKQPR